MDLEDLRSLSVTVVVVCLKSLWIDRKNRIKVAVGGSFQILVNGLAIGNESGLERRPDDAKWIGSGGGGGGW